MPVLRGLRGRHCCRSSVTGTLPSLFSRPRWQALVRGNGDEKRCSFCGDVAALPYPRVPTVMRSWLELARSAGPDPASFGRFSRFASKTLVSRAFAGRQAGNARKHWASGQPLRKCPFYAWFRAGVIAGLWSRRRRFVDASPRGRRCARDVGQARACPSAEYNDSSA